MRFYPTIENLQFLLKEIKNLRIESTIFLKSMKEMTLLYSNENCLIEGNLYNKIKEIKPRISQSIPYENIMFLDCYGNILKDDDSFNYKSFYLYVDYKINVTIRYNGICKKTFNDIKINIRLNSLKIK